MSSVETTPTSLDHRIDTEHETVCHLLPGHGKTIVSYCGVPRSEQPVHGKGGWELVEYNFCPYCGLKRCKACAERAGEQRG